MESDFLLLVEEITNNECTELVSRVHERMRKLRYYIDTYESSKCKCKQLLTLKENGDAKRIRFTEQETVYIRKLKQEGLKSSDIVELFIDMFPRWQGVSSVICYEKIKRLKKVPQKNDE